MYHLTEHTRRAYLEAMGVTQWYARHPVANGQDMDWHEAENVASGEDVDHAANKTSGADILARVGAGKAVEPTLSTPAQEPSVRTSSETAESPSPVDTPEATSAGPQTVADSTVPPIPRRKAGVEFIQRWWARGPWCIVDTRAKNMPQAQQKAADRLMAALAQVVCGERKPEVAHHIDWPLFVNRSIPHDIKEARFYLSQKWEALQQQSPTQRLIMLGDQTPELLGLDLNHSESSTWTTDTGISCLKGPGTSELMHLPGQKREFWKQMQQWLTESGS